MRRIVIVISAALSMGVLAACADDDDTEKKDAAAKKAKVYFGWMTGTEEVAAVALEVDPPDKSGKSKVRAYLCDGRGEPEGKAIWFAGPVDIGATTARGKSVTLASAGGKEDLVLDFVSDRRIQGTFEDENGKRSQFAAYPAIDGAGIYEVTLDKELNYTGTSIDGNKLTAKADNSGRTSGTIKTADGEEVKFSVRSLALATPAELSSRGLAPDYGRYKKVNQVPGEYTAVIAPGGSHWLGRSGNVRGGSTGVNIIGLDKKC